ncbi:tRNA (adenosine(37)-N6)-dimethylallyltransferase MiaA [Alkalihalobacillus hwajinpoensis]|uniref:tRNA (adenosine(37)-N6)-dimethylallyltransferase MiaA n=1 Tax=Guptibacillus hwajinpoensis TaxID=208199 RepID=UPI0018842DB7|nr:tRNA (adenosine(37)-N6)-dimethylallyltransferase MiaA [Pseudalkalibacillus hwajinpoensis]MBF0708501.1 tRNA (adenosine(37)-N6)-dimethylallyltransferase MiaA [Pseudalkalibacillus hwajinpoensis]
MNKEKLVTVLGPTAVGKTKTSIELAKALDGEIISGDSMQIYRGMDIGTAKVTEDEMEGIPHYLIDIKQPTESFSAAEFQKLATELVTDINRRGKVPIIAGGTGLYVKSVTHQYAFSEAKEDSEYREQLEQMADKEGPIAFHERLKDVDPVSYETIHPNNVRRVVRALEVYHVTGEPVSASKDALPEQSPYNLVNVGLTMDRDVLYERINQRVDLMVEAGLLEEAQRLYDEGVRNCQSVQAIGYKEIYRYLEDRVSLEDAIMELKQNSRRYAKRQLTWFRHQMAMDWYDMTEHREEKIQEILKVVAGKLADS